MGSIFTQGERREFFDSKSRSGNGDMTDPSGYTTISMKLPLITVGKTHLPLNPELSLSFFGFYSTLYDQGFLSI